MDFGNKSKYKNGEGFTSTRLRSFVLEVECRDESFGFEGGRERDYKMKGFDGGRRMRCFSQSSLSFRDKNTELTLDTFEVYERRHYLLRDKLKVIEWISVFIQIELDDSSWTRFYREKSESVDDLSQDERGNQLELECLSLMECDATAFNLSTESHVFHFKDLI
jgi:hypothetical protein